MSKRKACPDDLPSAKRRCKGSTSYEEKQLFKYRFWKHIFELNEAALRDLLEEGNPVGNLDFTFCMPSDRHGYNFIPLPPVRDLGMFETDQKEAHAIYYTIHQINLAIRHYTHCCGKQVSEILGEWYYDSDEREYLPNGAYFDPATKETIIGNIIRLLCQHGLSTSAPFRDFVDTLDGFRIEICTVFGYLLEEDLVSNLRMGVFERMLESKDQPMREEYYQLVLWERPEDFNRLVDVYPLTSYDELHAWCENDEDMTRRLWRLRLSRLDPTRWPTFKDVPNVSREELEAMFSGHPSVVDCEDADDDE
jgi:hypothetical protein